MTHHSGRHSDNFRHRGKSMVLFLQFLLDETTVEKNGDFLRHI